MISFSEINGHESENKKEKKRTSRNKGGRILLEFAKNQDSYYMHICIISYLTLTIMYMILLLNSSLIKLNAY